MLIATGGGVLLLISSLVAFPCPCVLRPSLHLAQKIIRGSFVVSDSKGTRRYSPTVMTGEGKEETHKAMRLMLERGAPMLVTNPGAASPCRSATRLCLAQDVFERGREHPFRIYAGETVYYPYRLG